ncbi:lipopolysaccharide core heptose(II) kinase RfaY [Brenneria populi subsp. brevivirga]|uniref:lipopolysaccharide core heptose(II) kinase RfaY n=1 Tax=Brenneria populi TaxID=1505588 RepID=UPI002E18D1C7|nr:lipopolysaccharide core heptose(II) kinase RfaY [Brenneria populi subsp. brevivirga]
MPEIIFRREAGGFLLYEKSRRGAYVQVLRDFCLGKIPYQELSSGSVDRKVYLINVDNAKYVLKWERERDPRLEKRISRFIFGPYYSRLIYRVAAAREQGCTKTADVYAVAEKVRHREALETYVLTEYIEGKPLAELSDFSPYKEEIKTCIEDLHRHRLASNDIHPGNIILTGDGLRIIDLSDAGSLTVCRVNDAFALKKFYDIDLRINNVMYLLIGLRNKFRAFSRKLRGKKQ